ncbi:hypothetical protein AVEN_24309-1 [Araneus ventricosus]|uniref:Uncharacterized protein n=1 Tax=Araneus ventricosus TaxID=182803 RepID=A0A4Y2PHD1_ARAVE|nr:hypothetical protein AVEN_24309-1 [Araneus ventricosus]
MLTVVFYVLLFGSAGDKWKTQRKMLNPCFRSDILKEHLLIINEQSQILVKLLEGETEKDSTKISKFLSDCTFDIICELIPDVIDRFRTYPIGLSGDIEKALLMLPVANQDREFLRFFYPCDEELVYRHYRVVFGVSCSPFLLNAPILYLLDNSPPEFHDMAEKLKCSFYVDNCLTGLNDPCDQASFIERTQTLMSWRGFNLRDWVSNMACEFISKYSGDASVLGLLWNLDGDKLRCNIDFEVLSRKPLCYVNILSSYQLL